MPNLKVISTATQTTGEVTGTTNGAAISLDGARSFSAQVSVTVDTPTAKTFTDTDVNVGTDVITVTSHGFTTGDKIRLTSTGTLPAGLLTGTDYFVISLTSSTIAFGSSLANALAGTKINITDAGSVGATNTITPTAIAGGSVTLQKSNDNSNWSTEGSATNITATAVIWIEQVNPTALYYRLQFTLTAGQFSASSVYVVKGYN